MEFLYVHILKPFLFKLDPEHVHNRFVAVGEFLGSFGLGRALLNLMYGYHGPDISKTVDGITYKTPVLLSAGFDYNGRLSQALPSIGFGGEEIGSVTARECEGNAKPRLTRLPKSQSLIVFKGLRNEGVGRIIRRLQSRQHLFVTGVSIARTNDEEAADTESGITDYFTTLSKLVTANVGDYYTINISCPNAFGGENFAEPQRLRELLTKLKLIHTHKPVYVKMPINLAWPLFDALLKVIVEFGLQGVIIGNLNKNYDYLDFRDEAPAEYRGGLSGKPCFELSNELIRHTRQAYGNKFTIIGCGGIMSAEDAMDKFNAGADLVQLITGMIFHGPQLISQIDSAYARLNSNSQT